MNNLFAKYDQQDLTANNCGFSSYIDMFVDLEYYEGGYAVLSDISRRFGLRFAMCYLNA